MKSKTTRKGNDTIEKKQKEAIAQSPYKNTPKLGEAMDKAFRSKDK